MLSVKTGNALPKSVTEYDELNVVKSKLKYHYPSVAFENVPGL